MFAIHNILPLENFSVPFNVYIGRYHKMNLVTLRVQAHLMIYYAYLYAMHIKMLRYIDLKMTYGATFNSFQTLRENLFTLEIFLFKFPPYSWFVYLFEIGKLFYFRVV